MSAPRTLAWLRFSLRAIDHVYFGGSLAVGGVRIRWARWPMRVPGHRDRSQFYFGWYCDETRVISMNRALAHAWVPDFVVIATIYHEALHYVIGPEHDGHFELAEQRYVHHAKAEVWESENIGALLLADNPHKRAT